MKKKFIISTFAIAAMALTAFTGYKTLGPKKSTSDLLLDENIEALTQGEIGGYYKKNNTHALSLVNTNKVLLAYLAEMKNAVHQTAAKKRGAFEDVPR